MASSSCSITDIRIKKIIKNEDFILYNIFRDERSNLEMLILCTTNINVVIDWRLCSMLEMKYKYIWGSLFHLNTISSLWLGKKNNIVSIGFLIFPVQTLHCSISVLKKGEKCWHSNWYVLTLTDVVENVILLGILLFSIWKDNQNQRIRYSYDMLLIHFL